MPETVDTTAILKVSAEDDAIMNTQNKHTKRRSSKRGTSKQNTTVAARLAEQAWMDVFNSLRLLGYHEAVEQWALRFLASKGIHVTRQAIRATWAVYCRTQERRAAGENPEPTAKEEQMVLRAFGVLPAEDDEAESVDSAADGSTRWLCDLLVACGLDAWLKSAAEKGQNIVHRRTRAKRTANGQMELHIYAQLAPAEKH